MNLRSTNSRSGLMKVLMMDTHGENVLKLRCFTFGFMCNYSHSLIRTVLKSGLIKDVEFTSNILKLADSIIVCVFRFNCIYLIHCFVTGRGKKIKHLLYTLMICKTASTKNYPFRI